MLDCHLTTEAFDLATNLLDLEATFHLGRAYSEAGDRQQAIQHFLAFWKTIRQEKDKPFADLGLRGLEEAIRLGSHEAKYLLALQISDLDRRNALLADAYRSMNQSSDLSGLLKEVRRALGSS